MLNKKKIIAIIPARGGSKGIRLKNLKKIGNKPLIYWPYIAAKKTKVFDRIVLSSDSKKIIKTAKKFNLDAPFIRPKKYAGNNSTSFSVVKHTLDFFKKKKEVFEYIVLLEPTSPFTEKNDILKALRKLIKNSNKFDSIVSVSYNSSYHPDYCFKNKKNIIIPFNKKVNNLMRQKLNKVFFLDGSIYISKVNSYIKNKGFIGNRTTFIEMPKYKSFEIDDILDYKIINFLFNNNEIKKIHKKIK